MISSTELFNITSENLTYLIMDYYSSIESSDSIVGDYDSNKKISSQDPSFSEIVSKDIQGDTIGVNLNSKFNLYGRLPENEDNYLDSNSSNKIDHIKEDMEEDNTNMENENDIKIRQLFKIHFLFKSVTV